MTASLISRKAPSKRTPLTEDQARLLVLLIRRLEEELLRHFGVRDAARIPCDRFNEIWALDGYRLFTSGAYACGFVCRDFTPDAPLDAARTRPREMMAAWTFRDIRHYVHTLVRAERWSDRYSSPILEAVIGGALREVADRLENDLTLYEAL